MSRSPGAEGRRGLGLFRRRKDDDLLERSIRACPGCDADVHVFAEVCRHCGGALEIFAA
jgi:predicted amidophosphoribosyltransferase